MVAITLFATALLTAAPDLDLESLKNVMDGLQADLKDVEFVYEGGVARFPKGETRQAPGSTFQGNFAFRSDGSVHVDIYENSADERMPLDRQVFCLSHRSKLETLHYQPDRGKGLMTPKASHGGLSSLAATTPLRIFRIPLVLEYLRDTGGRRTANDMRYECSGWQEVDGRRCLKIRLVSNAVTDGAPNLEEAYWLDMERGGNPLKYEYSYQGEVLGRAEDIQLKAFSLPNGQTYWLPSRGVSRSFLAFEKPAKGARRKASPKPTVEETYYLVDGTARFNQGLTDDRFTIGWSSTARSAGLQAAKAEFDRIARQPRNKGAQKRVEKAIVEADQQRALLTASNPSRESWSLGVGALALVGILSIGTAFFLKRRMR